MLLFAICSSRFSSVSAPPMLSFHISIAICFGKLPNAKVRVYHFFRARCICGPCGVNTESGLRLHYQQQIHSHWTPISNNINQMHNVKQNKKSKLNKPHSRYNQRCYTHNRMLNPYPLSPHSFFGLNYMADIQQCSWEDADCVNAFEVISPDNGSIGLWCVNKKPRQKHAYHHITYGYCTMCSMWHLTLGHILRTIYITRYQTWA